MTDCCDSHERLGHWDTAGTLLGHWGTGTLGLITDTDSVALRSML